MYSYVLHIVDSAMILGTVYAVQLMEFLQDPLRCVM